MKYSPPSIPAAGLVSILLAAACGPAVAEAVPGSVRPAATADASRPAAVGERADTTRPRRHTPADARFVRGMIAHHAQALEMVALVPARTRREELRFLAGRIEVSQQDEIAQMQRWLSVRGEEAPGAHAHHGDGAHARMPGMATPEEMARLAAAAGAEFDRLFLELMIRHHEGALAMVAELFAAPGAGQEPETFQLASEIDSDQRMEIERMRALLDGPLSGSRPR